MLKRRASWSPTLLRGFAADEIVASRPKQIALSGPAGFLGSRVFKAILDAHAHRKACGVPPGELVLLSSSPGTLMGKLYAEYGSKRMTTVRATRVDYYHQHDQESWHDQLGSLGLGGPDACFVNLAALAGPVSGRPGSMLQVNYRAPTAAGLACEQLGFGHFIQSSTQATKAERAGQVPYSRAKSMADFSLARMSRLPVSVLSLGLLYCKEDLNVGQSGSVLNMADLALLPLTPIMGSGLAPLQPLEVADAAERLAFLALTEPAARPVQPLPAHLLAFLDRERHYTLRMYDAVGPDTLSMLELMHTFARLNGRTLRPIFVDYRNFERVLNVASLGNLNRQFVSLLRSEQDAELPFVGNHTVFENILGPAAKLVSLNEQTVRKGRERRNFPYVGMIKWALSNHGVIEPGISLGVEILQACTLGNQTGAPICVLPEDRRSRNKRRVVLGTAALALALALAGSAYRYAGRLRPSEQTQQPTPYDRAELGGDDERRLSSRKSLLRQLTRRLTARGPDSVVARRQSGRAGRGQDDGAD